MKSSENGLYVELIASLLDIETTSNFSADIRVKARNLKEAFLKYETILLAQIFLRIFDITEPLSKYLQTKGLDILKSQQLVTSANSRLQNIQRNFDVIKIAADNFVHWVNEQFSLKDLDIEAQYQLPTKRKRIVKRMVGELIPDQPIDDAIARFEVEVYNAIMDTIVESMNTRFDKNKDLYFDLSFLSPAAFPAIKNGKLPDVAFHVLSNKLVKIDPNITIDLLQKELIHFAHSWENLKKSAEEEAVYFKEEDFTDSDSDSDSSDERSEIKKSEPGTTEIKCKNCRECVICCFKFLMQYNLYSKAYKHLTVAYKYLLTLPVTQVSCERSFSVLKFIKNRLRNSLSDEHLEAFILMSVENFF